MITKIWYSVQNCGDGSAYPKLMESEELCEIDQRFMYEGWGESCVGCIEVKSKEPIVVTKIITLDNVIKETEKELTESWVKDYPEEIEKYKEKLSALKKLKKIKKD